MVRGRGFTLKSEGIMGGSLFERMSSVERSVTGQTQVKETRKRGIPVRKASTSQKGREAGFSQIRGTTCSTEKVIV